MPAPPRDTLIKACEILSERDAALAKSYALHGLPTWRTTPAKYHSLARTVAYQQISLSAAGAIWGRVVDHFGGLGKLTPHAVLAARDEDIRACGMSRPKVAHLKSIAEAMVSGVLNLSRVRKAPIDDARKELIAVKGIGPWTAEIFLLYSGALDAFPTADIGLMEAYKLLRGDTQRLDTKGFAKAGENWRPYRGVAAHLLWAHFHAVKAKNA